MKPSLALSLLLALAACGGGDDASGEQAGDAAPAAAPSTPAPAASTPAQPVANVDPCTLATREEVASTFGEIREGPTQGSGLRNERQCEYINTDGSWIKLTVYGGSDRWEEARALTNAQSPRDVAGIGDEAFAVKRGTDAVVYARRGQSILEVSCSCPAEVAENMARTAVAKL